MSTTQQSDAHLGSSIPVALREIADWLEQHSRLTPAYVMVRLAASDRVDLEHIAEDLGPDAYEDVTYGGDEVQIRRKFARHAEVYGAVPLRALTHVSPRPLYTPIIPRPCAPAGGTGSSGVSSAATGSSPRPGSARPNASPKSAPAALIPPLTRSTRPLGMPAGLPTPIRTEG